MHLCGGEDTGHQSDASFSGLAQKLLLPDGHHGIGQASFSHLGKLVVCGDTGSTQVHMGAPLP